MITPEQSNMHTIFKKSLRVIIPVGGLLVALTGQALTTAEYRRNEGPYTNTYQIGNGRSYCEAGGIRKINQIRDSQGKVEGWVIDRNWSPYFDCRW